MVMEDLIETIIHLEVICMKIDRKKFIDETTGNLDVAFEIIDGLCAVIDHYIASDEYANGFGSGCFCDPIGEVKKALKDNCIDEFIIVDGSGHGKFNL